MLLLFLIDIIPNNNNVFQMVPIDKQEATKPLKVKTWNVLSMCRVTPKGSWTHQNMAIHFFACLGSCIPKIMGPRGPIILEIPHRRAFHNIKKWIDFYWLKKIPFFLWYPPSNLYGYLRAFLDLNFILKLLKFMSSLKCFLQKIENFFWH
jgi:hypothetical protein